MALVESSAVVLHEKISSKVVIKIGIIEWEILERKDIKYVTLQMTFLRIEMEGIKWWSDDYTIAEK